MRLCRTPSNNEKKRLRLKRSRMGNVRSAGLGGALSDSSRSDLSFMRRSKNATVFLTLHQKYGGINYDMIAAANTGGAELHYFRVTIVTPSSPSPYTPGRKDLTCFIRRRCS